ncbi:MAG TPA: FMN-binding negative transcriptional regulator [Oligoflexus sp.]|uniref:FMN-binding negative transcriptional regulator n=1 Tax=Oligoflexus sp. TaxID=1971216 RepID=UPI002D7F095F|nr:FMN-binding negative transcriptional regulator [Oligoflexus sp.]HET9236095.1 FMN-binding negative transcriptional regulator [Oligoflexus sp.]
MQLYPIYQPQSPSMVQQFLRQRPYCLLITSEHTGPPETGFFNPLVEDQNIYLHLHRQDPQLKQLQQNPQATLVFTDFHGYVPSYAKHPEDASFATMFYRFVQIRASARVIEAEHEAAAILDSMMKRYQPEGGYLPIQANLDFYGPSLKMITVLHFTIESLTSKWKLGQNRNPQEQLHAHSFMNTMHV